MSDQSESSHFQTLFESAFQDYEKQTGIPLANHPLAEQLQNCQSAESVTTLLQEQARVFCEFREGDKIMKSLKSVVSALSRVSAVSTLGHDIGLSFPPAHAIHTGLGILLTAFKGVSSDLDILVDLLESIEHFLKRLDIYTKVPPTHAITEIVVRIIVELLSTLALATKQIRQGRPKKFVKKLFGENEVEAVLQRLDRLTQDEARTTAAQTLEVVYGLVHNMKVVIDDGNVVKASAESVRDVLEIIQEMASEMNRTKRDKIQQDIRSWLSPPDPWKNHHLSCKSRLTGTAAWFIGGSNLSEWKSSGPSSLLWIYGKPGAGKSVLCSTLIENIDSMRKSGLASVAFFYYDFREEEKRNLRGLLSSVLVQLCHQSDTYSQILSRFYFEHANGSRHPSDDALVRCLKNMLQTPGQAPVYLIVDGLDECSNTSAMPSPREEILLFLKDLIDSKISNLRICVTSRPEIDIKVALEPLAFRSVSLHDEKGQIEDIEEYIRSVVNTDPNIQKWKTAEKELVIDVLIKKSDGMFRWVYCQITYLRCCFPGRIRHALDELPETLDGTYERALRDIDKANWEFVHRLLQCVAVAFRPLRVAELAEILSFDFKTGSIPKFHEGWCLGDPVDAVRSTTSSFLSIVNVEGSLVIQFSHFSVKEFLTSSRLAETNDIICRRYHISMTPAHTLAAQVCLGLLLHLDKNIVDRDSLEKYSLVEYAAEHWADHTRFEGVSENVEDGMKQLFDPSKSHLAVWVWIHDPESFDPHSMLKSRRTKKPLQPKGSPLHYAAVCGLHTIVKFLATQHPPDVHSRDFSDNLTPLHLASRRGHEEVACFLLEHGADPTVQVTNGGTPLHMASESGHEHVVRLLLEHGANTIASWQFGREELTPLHQVSNERVARLLLEFGADANAQTSHGTTPLHRTSREDVAQLLLEHGADATARTKDGSTPLHRQWDDWNENLARVLLEHGADAAARNEYGSTPLHGARNEKVTRLLLEHGADATAQTENGITPLHGVENEKVAWLLLNRGADAAARAKDGSTPLHLTRSETIARLLLEHGADLTAQTRDGSTPLHTASTSGYEGIARLLLEHGADATARTKERSTPLHMTRNEKFARLLLEHGADATAQTKYGITPLHMASIHRQNGIARLLLEHGADAAARNTNGETPLHWADNEKVVRLLLKHDADAAARSKDGETPLHGTEDETVARLLLEHGADVTAQTKDGSTPLHMASRKGYEGIARLLLEHGADATAWAKDGSTPLHKTRNEKVARLLLEHGADLAAQTKDGSTPLHQTEDEKVARLLLEHGADLTAQTKDGSTPLHGTSREDVARLLLEYGADITAQTKDGSTPLHSMLDDDVTRLLLEHGADATARTKDGSTPLHRTLRPEIIRLLLKHGGDITSKTKNGETPLHVASRKGRKNGACLLLEYGADTAAQTMNGSTPLHVAVRFGHAKLVYFFAERGADVTARKKDGSTLLHLASLWGHIKVASFLLEHGVDATAPNKHGYTALHLASRWGHVEVVRFLLDHGVDARAPNKYGWTPLRLALHGGHDEVARLLVERGADTTSKDELLVTPSQVMLNQGAISAFAYVLAYVLSYMLARMLERDIDGTA